MPAECDALQPFVDVVASATYSLARLSLVYSPTMHAAQIAARQHLASLTLFSSE